MYYKYDIPGSEFNPAHKNACQCERDCVYRAIGSKIQVGSTVHRACTEAVLCITYVAVCITTHNSNTIFPFLYYNVIFCFLF